MARTSPVFICSACGRDTPKWQGQCPHCDEWNTLEAGIATTRPKAPAGPTAVPRPLDSTLGAGPERLPSGQEELDRVFGGGIVPGSVTLLGGDPGIGKSTLLLQVAAHVASVRGVLYASGEESVSQVGLRAQRLGLSAASLSCVAENDLQGIIALANERKVALLVVDSIQTVQSGAVAGSAGGVSQLRECTAELVRFAKAGGTAVLLVGHVTKEGQIAGPRVLEHMVDTVLYFESDTGSRFRVLRSVKNRFGGANEIGVFAMVEQGLREVTNPSAIFLSRHAEPVPGSVITVMREGTRSLLIEVQVLADVSLGANPRRVAVGIDGNRLTMLLAVAHRHAGLQLQGQDVFANVVGGVRLAETAGDLAIVMAARSSLRDSPVPNSLIAFGELGLAGEIRPVPFGEERLREAAKHGFTLAVVPEANVPKRAPEGMSVRGVTRLNQALDAF